MGMVVRTNTMSTNAYRQLGMNNSAVSKSLEKLSSGFRINRAGDDASGLAISEKMKAQINGLEQAAANSQDGISLIQTAEGATTEIHNMLNRMVTLATKSANGTIQNEVDREAIQTEVDALKTEITRIAKATNFNGINLLDGSMGTGTSGAAITTAGTTATASTIGVNANTYTLKSTEGLTVKFAGATGATKNQAAAFDAGSKTLTITLTGSNAATSTNYTYTETELNQLISDTLAGTSFAGASLDLANDIVIAGSTGTNPGTAAQIDTGLGTLAITGLVSTVAKSAYTEATVGTNNTKVLLSADKAGAFTPTFQVTNGPAAIGAAVAGDTGNTVLNLKATDEYSASELNSMMKDSNAGMSFSFSGKVKGSELQTSFSGAAALVNAGTGLASDGGLTLQVGDTNDSFNKVTVSVDNLTASGLGVDALDVTSQDLAGSAIKTIKDAINKVSTNRGNLGALQNRLEYTINNLDTTNENMTAANSRIRDTDMAKEMMNYTKMNILTQAAQAMLAQANQQPQQILQLLQ